MNDSSMFPPKIEAAAEKARRNLPENVIVAVKAEEKVVSKAALAWALTHVVHPGDCVILLAVFTGAKSSRKMWSWRRLNGDCRNTDDCANLPDRICQISESCSRMVLQFQNQFEVMVQIKVVSGTPSGGVATQAKYTAANWVILDKKLKQERKKCMEELQCNIVEMKGSEPKVLRLNLHQSNDNLQTPFFSAVSSPSIDPEKLLGHGVNHSTPVTSPEETSVFYPQQTNKSLFLVYNQNPLFETLIKSKPNNQNDPFTPIDSCGERSISLSLVPDSYPTNYNQDSYSSGIREAVSLGRTLSLPPPLCSLCQHQAPAMVKPLRQFYYSELQESTDGFSDSSFVAEGELWVVHRGVLKDGLVVAVKQSKFCGSDNDADFCKEVRVLSCAQHKNVVLLVGFCIEGNRRLLVYEYVCNGSLDIHLHEGNKRTHLDWPSRLKIAIGTATGLRYLHEDCRVGCIVHRDMRPKNILLTHDYEPLVADFGLVSLHTEHDTCNEERFIGTSGYLAPEYFNGEAITEKVDIYAFGLVLVELITGIRMNQLQCYKARDFWHDVYASQEMEPVHVLAYKHKLLDTRLGFYQPSNFPPDLHAIGHAASLCLQKDPESRPSMSKVLKVLEGDSRCHLSLDMNLAGNRSGHIQKAVIFNEQIENRGHYRKLSY